MTLSNTGNEPQENRGYLFANTCDYLIPLFNDVDFDFDLDWIGDEERGIPVEGFFFSDVWIPQDEADDNESSNRFFWVLIVEFVDPIGVENKSATSPDWYDGEGEVNFTDGTSRTTVYGLEDDSEDDSSRSCSCSDRDGVELDEAIDDVRALEESIGKC